MGSLGSGWADADENYGHVMDIPDVWKPKPTQPE